MASTRAGKKSEAGKDRKDLAENVEAAFADDAADEEAEAAEGAAGGGSDAGPPNVPPAEGTGSGAQKTPSSWPERSLEAS
jgi:hypothetical protein